MTSKTIGMLIEQVDQELVKEKRNRGKEEREMENRRVNSSSEFSVDIRCSVVPQDETSHLISELKEQMSQHNILFKDISSVLKSLLRVIELIVRQ